MGLLSGLRTRDRRGARSHRPDLTVIGVEPEVLEDGAESLVMYVHQRWAKDTAEVLASRECLDLVFAEWDDDARELWEIPQVVKYVKELHHLWPEAPWFLSRVGGGLQLMQLCLTAARTRHVGPLPDDVRVTQRSDALRGVLEDWFRGLNRLAAMHGIDPDLVAESSRTLGHYVTHGPEGAS